MIGAAAANYAFVRRSLIACRHQGRHANPTTSSQGHSSHSGYPSPLFAQRPQEGASRRRPRTPKIFVRDSLGRPWRPVGAVTMRWRPCLDAGGRDDPTEPGSGPQPPFCNTTSNPAKPVRRRTHRPQSRCRSETNSSILSQARPCRVCTRRRWHPYAVANIARKIVAGCHQLTCLGSRVRGRECSGLSTLQLELTLDPWVFSGAMSSPAGRRSVDECATWGMAQACCAAALGIHWGLSGLGQFTIRSLTGGAAGPRKCPG